MSLKKLILDTLAENGESQAQLARKTGIPLTTINSWVLGTRGVSPGERGAETLRKLADGLGLPARTVFKAAGRWVPEPTTEAGEQALLDMYRTLPPGDREVVNTLTRSLYLKHSQSKSAV